LIVCKITPSDTALPITVSRELIRPERISLEKKLLDLEQQYNGLSAAYVGSCLYCPEGACTRADGKPCRYPECVRPSLEGYGFDIAKTTKEIFGMDLLWGNDGCMPEYLLLVCGLFHNENQINFL
jgi:predicted metal-binding protein